MKYILLLSCCLLFVGCESAAPATPTTAVLVTATVVGTAVSGPSAGLRVSAEAQDTLIKLSWNSLPNVSGYLIYRDSNAKPLIATPITSLLYEDMGLTNGRTYTYSVAALDGAGQISARSTEVKATPKSK